MLIGESLGAEEVRLAEPFVGAAGATLNRILHRAGLDRDGLKIANCIRCQPPQNKLDRTYYKHAALGTCKKNYLDGDIEGWVAGSPPNRVLVPLGGVALRNILNPAASFSVQDFHGYVLRDPTDRFWVVPNYHPSHIQRGAWNLFGVAVHDFQVAARVAQEGFTRSVVSLVIDPDPGWFERWIDEHEAALRRDPESIWLAVDIETPDKQAKTDEGELSVKKDRSFEIIRVNVSNATGQGITVPYSGPFITLLKRLLKLPGVKCFWNAPYDVPRLQHHGVELGGESLDFMWAWHVLESDLPRGLGFVAPFYSDLEPWKHLSTEDFGKYSAMDAVQTIRLAHGIARDLTTRGQWDVFWRHVHVRDTYCMRPAEAEGMPIDEPELHRLDEHLDKLHAEITTKIQEIVPIEVKPLTGGNKKEGLVHRPEGEENIVEKTEPRLVRKCFGCGDVQVPTRHRCKVEGAVPRVELAEVTVTRYYRREDFNVGSWQQILAYIKHKKHPVPKSKKTGLDTTEKEGLQQLSKKTKDPFYKLVLDDRAITKVSSTYVKGSLIKLKTDPRSIADGRLHTSFAPKASTLRDTSSAPNLQNVVADRGGDEEQPPAAGFRFCIVASPGCYLMEFDFSGIELVLTGWFCGDPNLIRLAKLGFHAYLASHMIGEPADYKWSNDDLLKHFSYIKERHRSKYDEAKRVVYLSCYAGSPRMMHMTYPGTFPTIASAEKTQQLYYSLAPTVPAWQTHVQELAYKQQFLGGPAKHGETYHTSGAHPFGYRHRFFNVLTYRTFKGVAPRGAQVVRVGNRNYLVYKGDDAKRCVAFFPQSTAAGILKEAMLRLFLPDMPNYIGDVKFGRTPLIAPVHDSLLLEVPGAKVDLVTERVVTEMTRPIAQLPNPGEWNLGSHLSIGVEGALGRNWALFNDRTHDKNGRELRLNLDGMKKHKLPNVSDSLAADVIVPVDYYDEEEEPEVIDGQVQAAG